MELSEEIQLAARQLGQSLQHDEYVHAYLDALQESQTDLEASTLEKKMYEVYEALITHEQSDEQLGQTDIHPFNELRQQVQAHPLIVKRNNLLRLVKPFLNQVADEISFVLGVDYLALAKPR